jgi:hypothetical protein
MGVDKLPAAAKKTRRDISQNSIEGYPFVLSAVETLDLTHEVIQRLKQ